MALKFAQKGVFRIIEQVYALIGLLYVLNALNPFFVSRAELQDLQAVATQVTDGSLASQLFGTGIYLIALGALLPRLQDVIVLLNRNKALVLFIAVILASALWSDLPAVTLRRSLALLGTTFFAVYLALNFRPTELLNLLALAFGITIVESILFVLLAPDIAIHWTDNYGAWKGSYGQKNTLGRSMVLAILVMWIVLPQVRAMRPAIWATMAIAVLLIVMSQSRTSWIAAVCLLLALPFLNHLRRSGAPVVMRFALVFLFGIGGVAFLVLQFADAGLAALGRDATFSGRTNIWEAAISVGMEQPLLGHGYRTFWTRGLTNRLLIGNGHNSFLDVWLELGFVGFGIFLVTLVTVTRRALRRMTQSSDRLGLWYIMFILFMALFSMAAQVFPDHGTIPWILYVVVTLYLTPFAAQSRRHVLVTPDKRGLAPGVPAPAE